MISKTHIVESKRMGERYTMHTMQTVTKRAGVTTLISNKIEFKKKNINKYRKNTFCNDKRNNFIRKT